MPERRCKLAGHRPQPEVRRVMKQSLRTLFATGLIPIALIADASAQQTSQQEQRLGKVSFPTSCDSKVQAEFDRGVAMLHSYWFIIARRSFEGILQQRSEEH